MSLNYDNKAREKQPEKQKNQKKEEKQGTSYRKVAAQMQHRHRTGARDQICINSVSSSQILGRHWQGTGYQSGKTEGMG